MDWQQKKRLWLGSAKVDITQSQNLQDIRQKVEAHQENQGKLVGGVDGRWHKFRCGKNPEEYSSSTRLHRCCLWWLWFRSITYPVNAWADINLLNRKKSLITSRKGTASNCSRKIIIIIIIIIHIKSIIIFPNYFRIMSVNYFKKLFVHE